MSVAALPTAPAMLLAVEKEIRMSRAVDKNFRQQLPEEKKRGRGLERQLFRSCTSPDVCCEREHMGVRITPARTGGPGDGSIVLLPATLSREAEPTSFEEEDDETFMRRVLTVNPFLLSTNDSMLQDQPGPTSTILHSSLGICRGVRIQSNTAGRHQRKTSGKWKKKTDAVSTGRQVPQITRAPLPFPGKEGFQEGPAILGYPVQTCARTVAPARSAWEEKATAGHKQRIDPRHCEA